MYRDSWNSSSYPPPYVRLKSYSLTPPKPYEDKECTRTMPTLIMITPTPFPQLCRALKQQPQQNSKGMRNP